MPTLATADLHVAASPRDAYRWQFLESTLPRLIAEYVADRVLILGDLTEAKDGHSAALVNRLVDGIAAIAEETPVYILKGNHDYIAEGVPFFRHLRHLPRVHWINAPTRLKLRGLGDCLLLPHTRNLEDWVDSMREDHDWFFCHQTFGGADLGSGRRAEGAAPPFTKGARVVSGDIHAPQRLGPVTYVGAPYTVDFGDNYTPRVLLLEDHRMKSIPVPGPQKRLVTLSGRDPLAALSMRHPLAATLPIQSGDVVKVRVELPPRAEVSRAEVRARVREWADAAGVELYTTEVIAPRAATAKASRDRHRASDTDLVRAYAKKMKKGKATIAVGLKIMEQS
jgi:hypothetical protein